MSSHIDEPVGSPNDQLRRNDLEAIVSSALEMRDGGRSDWLAEACRGHPGIESEVLAAVERADALPGLMGGEPALDPLRGRRLGRRFRLIDRIGVGSMGAVYLAEDLELRRKVACKVVHHGLMAPEQALARFEREAQAMAAVQHPSVVTIYDRGRTDGDQVYIVMELVDGPSLSRLLEAAQQRARVKDGDECSWIGTEFGVDSRGESSYVRTVVRWVADLALGLEAVHRAGVLHRDIKPSNILVRRDGRPTLLDFGIALLDDQNSATRTPASLGTPAYMPPETLQRAGRRTPASDVYSLTATLYHLLTLHAPYEGSPTQILAQLASRDPVPASQRRPGLPRDLQALLDKGMHRNPARRYASAAAFEADLRAFLEFRPIAARPVTPLERVLRKVQRSRAAMGALAALALVATALGARSARAHYLDARRAEYAELARHFPPNFTVVGAANRVYRYDADREAVAALLDQAADVAVEPLPTFLLRASFRQDHGDPAGAASDMQQVAAFVGTPLARELSARYAAADGSARGAGAIDLTSLPEPDSALDRYLLGYHRLRQGQNAEALELLADPEVRRIPHAEELYLAFSDFDRVTGADRHRLALDRYADLVRLESRLGARTAATAHVAGRMLAIQGRFEEASNACDEGIVLAPRAHVLRINAGYCAFAQGKLEDARQHLNVARDLRPNYAHVVENLFWVEIADRRFEVAADLALESGPQLVPPSSTWVDYWSGVIASYAALDAKRSGDAATCAGQLDVARTCFGRVQGRVRDEGGRPTDTALRIASALEKDDDQALLLALLELVADKPESWWRQQLLLQHMPAELGPSATDALRRFIEALDTRTPSSFPR
ncbi:MAG: protein kinase [Planctomycetota bacterium]|nr:protein kinase [Planctomycetota bacterium]